MALRHFSNLLCRSFPLLDSSTSSEGVSRSMVLLLSDLWEGDLVFFLHLERLVALGLLFFFFSSNIVGTNLREWSAFFLARIKSSCSFWEIKNFASREIQKPSVSRCHLSSAPEIQTSTEHNHRKIQESFHG